MSELIPLIDAELSTMPDAAQKLLRLARDEIVRLRTPPGEGELVSVRRQTLRGISALLNNPKGSDLRLARQWLDEAEMGDIGSPDPVSRPEPVAQRTAADALLAQAALLGEARKVLAAVLADIDEYERVNDLHPNPGRTECWDSVKAGKVLLTKLDAAT